MSQLELFAEPITCNRCGAPAQPRRQRADVCTTCSNVNHWLMPNMNYACYENILSVAGHFTSKYSEVNCLGCLDEGWDNIQRRARRQRGQCAECSGAVKKDVCADCGAAQ